MMNLRTCILKTLWYLHVVMTSSILKNGASSNYLCYCYSMFYPIAFTWMLGFENQAHKLEWKKGEDIYRRWLSETAFWWWHVRHWIITHDGLSYRLKDETNGIIFGKKHQTWVWTLHLICNYHNYAQHKTLYWYHK